MSLPHSVFMTAGINCFKVCLKIKALPHTPAFSYLLAQRAGAGSVFWFRKLLPSSRSVKTHFFGSGWARRCWLEVSSALPGSPESAHQNPWLLRFVAMELQDPHCGAFALWVPVTMKSMILSLLESLQHWLQRLPWSTIIQMTLLPPPPNFLVVFYIRGIYLGPFPQQLMIFSTLNPSSQWTWESTVQ